MLFKVALFLFVVSLLYVARGLYLDYTTPFPEAGGEYTEGLIGAPKFINPILAQTNDTDMDICRLVFSGLFRIDKNQELVNDLAESYDVSENQKEYTFHLRHDARFHDGEDLNADDLVFTFESILDPDFASPLNATFAGVSIERLDDHTIKFILREEFAPFPSTLTFGVLPEHIWAEITPENATLAKQNTNPTGSGPYKFSEIKKDQDGNIKSYLLEKNELYYDHAGYIEKITFKFYPDLESSLEAVKNKRVEGVSFVPKDSKAEVSKQNKSLEFYSLRLPQYTAIFFNQKNELLQDRQIREALALSIDKDRILQQTLLGEGEIIHGPILPGYLGYNPEIKKYQYDLEAAKKVLDDNGWVFPEVIEEEEEEEEATEEESTEEESAEEASESKDNDDEEEPTAKENTDNSTEESEEGPKRPVRMKDGKELAFAITTINQSEYLETIEVIKESWQALGVRLETNVYSSKDIQKKVIKTRDYEALLFGEIIGTDPDPYPFWHSSQSKDPGLNLAVFYNKDIDQLLEEARKTNDEEQRRIKYIHFQNTLIDELPAIFLYNPAYTYAVDKKIKGIASYYITMPSDRFAAIHQWHIKVNRDWGKSENY